MVQAAGGNPQVNPHLFQAQTRSAQAEAGASHIEILNDAKTALTYITQQLSTLAKQQKDPGAMAKDQLVQDPAKMFQQMQQQVVNAHDSQQAGLNQNPTAAAAAAASVDNELEIKRKKEEIKKEKAAIKVAVQISELFADFKFQDPAKDAELQKFHELARHLGRLQKRNDRAEEDEEKLKAEVERTKLAKVADKKDSQNGPQPPKINP